MGCAASRVANEDTVRRCKERRRLMKDAVVSRHHLAAAHSDYLRSLRYTASALSLFSSFQTLTVSDPTPTVLLHPAAAAAHPPPPPLSSIASSPLPPSSVASTPLPPSSFASTPKPPPPPPPQYATTSPSVHPPTPFHMKERPFATASNYAATPSQASSAWNWENFYPPSPPGSDFFDRLNKPGEAAEEEEDDLRHSRRDEDDSETESHHHLPKEDEDDGISSDGEPDKKRDEVHSAEWGDRYSRTTTTSTKSDGGEEEDELRSVGFGARSDYFESSAASLDRNSRRYQRHHLGRAPLSDLRSMSSAGRSRRDERWREEESTSTTGQLQMVVQHRDLKEIITAIEECFIKAAEAGEALSELLETGRAQLDRSFRQLKKTVYHSNSVLSSLSSTWSSKPPLAIKYRLDTAALDNAEGKKSHCSALERLLTWEKKLYEEVKEREGLKIEHEKKLSALQRQEYKGKNDSKLDKTKASINRLHSQILVTTQAVSTTSSAIIKVRDDELAPQLVQLSYGFLQMWRSMNQFHNIQNHIVQQVRGLVNYSAALEPTSDLHRQATRDLESAVTDWHSSFVRLIKFHREYICAVYSWLKLTLCQVSNDEPQKDHYSSLVSSELTTFCDEWKQALERLPDTVAAQALKSFVNVINSISLKQTEEIKIKKRAESYSKELEKKTLSLRNVEKKFYQSYSMVGIGIPDGGLDSHGQVFDSRDPLTEKKAEIAACRRKVEEEMARHTKAIKVTRDMTLNNIQTGLPGVFQAMTGFSGLFAEALESVCGRSGSCR